MARAMVLPQVIATPIAGFLLDKFQVVGKEQNIANLGYTVIFLLAVVYFALGTVFVKQIKKVKLCSDFNYFRRFDACEMRSDIYVA